MEFQKWLSLHRSRYLILGAFKFNKDITKPTNGKLVSDIQMETILFNDNQQHTPSKAVTKPMPAIFLRELSSETIPPGLIQASDPDGAEQAAKHPPSWAPKPCSQAQLPSSWPPKARVSARHVAKGLLTGCVIGMALLGTPEPARGPQTLTAVAVSFPCTVPIAGTSRVQAEPQVLLVHSNAETSCPHLNGPQAEQEPKSRPPILHPSILRLRILRSHKTPIGQMLSGDKLISWQEMNQKGYKKLHLDAILGEKLFLHKSSVQLPLPFVI